MANPAPTINQINAFNATQGTTIDFNIIGGTELVRSNRIYIYDLSDNSLICTHLYASTESIHELPPNTDGSIVYESGKSSADFVNGAQYYAQIQTFTDTAGTEGGSGLSVAKMFWCLNNPTLTIDTIPSTISTTSYNVSATYNANTSVVSNIIQQYQFNLYSATGSLLQSSGVVVGSGEQQGTSTAYDISYNFTGLSVGSSYYVAVDVTTTQGMSINTQSNTFTISIDTPTLGEATVVNNACDGYISVTSNLSSEYGGSGSGDIVTFETDSENVFTKLQVTFQPTQSGSGTPSPSNVRPIYGVGGVEVDIVGKNLFDESVLLQVSGWTENDGVYSGLSSALYDKFFNNPIPLNCAENEVYTFSCKFKSTNGLTLFFRFHYSDGTRSATQSASTSETRVTFVSTKGKTLTGLSFSYTATDVIYLSECQLELGTTVTEYEPYQEQTYTATLPQTVYGGTLDLVSGRLVVDKKYMIYDGSDGTWALSASWGKTNTAVFYNIKILSNIKYEDFDDNPYLCETLLTASRNELYENDVQAFGFSGALNQPQATVRIDKTIASDVTTFVSWIKANPLHILVPLTTPLTYQLTPKQIQTLVGTNNVWSEQGDIELSYHIPITNLLVKRQDIDDVSGNWLTLYSQPITQASDMDFTFIDFLNQYGKTYKYALVPLLTQTQSGVEVEVEGGYTVSDEVQSIFDGVFISDSTGSQKCKANVGYGNVNMNQSVGSITPIGSQYPIIVTNSNNRYHNGSISGMIVPDDYYYNGNLSRIDMVNKRNELEQFLTNKRAKIIKDWNSNIWLVMIMDNIDCSFDNNYGMGIVTFNANWLEVGDPTNQEDLQATGLVDVGGV